jgi:hypothetical protein
MAWGRFAVSQLVEPGYLGGEMLERLRRALVNSFVGAIALGWVFAQAIVHFAYIFSAPAAGWLTRREYHGMADRVATDFSLRDALPECAESISLFLVGYVLLRWLYYRRSQTETPLSNPEQTL